MIQDTGFILAGFVLLFLGGEGLVRGSVAVAEKLGLSKLLIGLTVVAFGTSTPELIVSVNAALSGAPDIALGNVVGSNIANVLLILGLSALIAPVVGWQRTAMRDAMVMTFAALALFGLTYGAAIGQLEGAVLLMVLVAYLAASYWLERRDKSATSHVHETEAFEGTATRSVWIAAGFVAGGILALVFGADLLVRGSVSIARSFGVSDAVIGLTLVAVGTSLPELATSIIAAWRRQSDVVLGNVIGSNIFNVLAILGLTAIIAPIPVSAQFRLFDTPVMLFVSVLVVLLLVALKRIGRGVGLAMLAAYAAYVVWQFVGAGV
jgi:cation:H+ antiporter